MRPLSILVGLATFALGGCAVVSGLSDLEVVEAGAGDAAVDVTLVDAPVDVVVDAALDGTPDVDASPADSGVDADAAVDSGPRPVGIMCGPTKATCDLNTQICCLTGSTYACVSAACGALHIRCDDTSDCPGKICCAHSSNSVVDDVACEDAVSCVGVFLCDPAAPSPCPTPKKCTGPAPNGLSSNYRTCQ